MRQLSRLLPFLGAYFDTRAIFRLVTGAQVAAWVILALYVLELFFNTLIFTLQILRGFMAGLGPTDYASQILYFLKQPLAGILFFFILQATAQGLLLLLEIESNTRLCKA